MVYGLPAIGEATWGQKVTDSVDAVKATADAALPSTAHNWTANTAYAVGDIRQAPDGSTIRRNAAGTSGAAFDAPLAAPVLNAPTTATTGGTLAAGTYYYKITATNALGETVGSNEVSQATTGTTSTVGLSWAAISGATGYKVYRATTSGGQSTSPALLATVGAVTSYTDTGAAVAAGAVPSTNTTSEKSKWTAVLEVAGTMDQVALSATIADFLSAPDAIGDGLSHPLSASFATLAEAQARFPAATALTDEWDWAAIQSRANERGWVYLQATQSPDTLTGGYVINKPITCDVVWGDEDMTLITQTASNTPILVSTGGVRHSNLLLRYQTAQTSAHTNSNGIQLTDVHMGSSLRRISVQKSARGIYNVAPGYTFSTTFQDIDINGFAITGFDVSNAGGITGNVITNLYIHNNPTGTAATSTEAPFKIGGWYDGVVTQLNIEDCIADRAITFNTNRHVTFNSVHLERFTMTGEFGGLIEFNNYTDRAIFSGLTVLNCNFLTADITSGLSALFKVIDGTQVIVHGLDASENTVTIGQLALVYATGITNTRSTRVTFDNSSRGEFTLDQVGDASKYPIVANFNGSDLVQVGDAATPLLAGNYYGGEGNATATPPEAYAQGHRVIAGRSCTITTLAVNVTTAGSVGAVVRLGLYYLNPITSAMTLLVDGGTVDATTTGVKTVTISQAVTKGDQVVPVVSVQGAAATRPVLTHNNAWVQDPYLGHSDAGTAFSTALSSIQVAGVSGALPATATASAGGQGPRVLLKAS